MSAWHVDPQFASALSTAQVAAIAASDDVVYLVDDRLTIRGHNAAYAAFGAANGCPAIERDFGVGTSLLRVLRGDIGEVYLPAYGRAMARHERFDHDYECSSPAVFRRFHQSAYPLPGGRGLVVTHHLTYQYPQVWRRRSLRPRHFDERGWLTQCACCRKVKDQSVPDRWDWVPRVVAAPHPRTVQAYCSKCRAFWYGDTVRWTPVESEAPPGAALPDPR